MKKLFNLYLTISIVILTTAINYKLGSIMPANKFEAIGTNTSTTPSKLSSLSDVIWSVTFVDEQNGWAVGDSSIILKTTNGGEDWIQQPSPVSANFFDISFIDSDNGWIVGDYKTILRTQDGGVNWIVQSGNDPSYNYYGVSFTNLNDGIVVGYYGLFEPIIIKTTDGGSDWVEQSQGASGGLSGLCFADEYVGTAVGQLGTILRTSDGGATWIAQSSNNPSFLFGVDFMNSNVGFVTGETGTILKTTDGGENWISQTSNVIDILTNVSFIDSDNAIVVGGNGIILKTIDGGLTWLQQSSGTNNWLQAVHFIDGNTGWAVGEGNTILKTTDGGINWFQQSIGTTNTEEEKNNMPAQFVLEQNYPNPFNPTTSIRYQVSGSSNVSLEVYDVLGKEVTTLVNEEKPTGTYKVSFNASELSSGIYFYKLQAGSLVETKKMILMK